MKRAERELNRPTLFDWEAYRLQKPTRIVSVPTKWKVSPKTDEVIGNSGTATAVPAVPGEAPLESSHLPVLHELRAS